MLLVVRGILCLLATSFSWLGFTTFRLSVWSPLLLVFFQELFVALNCSWQAQYYSER